MSCALRPAGALVQLDDGHGLWAGVVHVGPDDALVLVLGAEQRPRDVKEDLVRVLVTLVP